MTASHLLTEDEVRFFSANGFVTPRYRLDAETSAQLAADVQRVVEDNSHMRNKPITTALRGVDRTGRNDLQRNHRS